MKTADPPTVPLSNNPNPHFEEPPTPVTSITVSLALNSTLPPLVTQTPRGSFSDCELIIISVLSPSNTAEPLLAT